MRQWFGIDPSCLCRQHLLGEHVEQHMAASWVLSGKRLGKLFTEGWIDPGRIRKRHDACAREMKRRGYNHKSPLRYKDPVPSNNQNRRRHRRELVSRCKECKRRLNVAQGAQK